MKRIVLILYGIFMVVKSDNRVWTPIDTLPLTCAYPCKNSSDISAWFELGVPLKELDQYYVHINKTFPVDSVTKVSFDTGVKITFTVRSNEKKFSRITLKKSHNFTIRFFDQLAGLSVTVKRTTPGLVPRLTGLAIDDEEFCGDPDLGFLEKYTAETERMPQDGEYQWYAEGQKPKNINCGQRKVGHTDPTINGATKPGDWPWHAAIYLRKPKKLQYEYICGGTLISESFVLTAAHCTARRGGIPLTPEILTVWLGKYYLYITDKESEMHNVEKVIINDKYDHRHLLSDIALLKLKPRVQFTEYIQPACLGRAGATDTLNSTTIVGNIVGWGYDNDNKQADTLQQAVFPTVSMETCIRSYPNFYALYTNWKTFCAGYLNNGTSACNGDSGGGYQVFVPNKEQEGNGSEESGAWHVLGVISHVPALPDAVVCDSDYYTVFTDVAKHRDWIDSYLDD